MNNLMRICSIKCFSRMRNKAQMFSSMADDHFHTRLMHSMEVYSVAKAIAEKFSSSCSIDDDLLTSIALLHDIGHTPYGHIGERTLNKICSGEMRINEDGPDFKELGCSCGFKHNINSGILYKEYLIKSKQDITSQQCNIIDGITKHSSLFYKNDKDNDYGFSYVNCGLKKPMKFQKELPNTIEGIIVFYADEIAQIFCDYKDLVTGGFDVSELMELDIFQKAIHKLVKDDSNQKDFDYNSVALEVVNYMIDLFSQSFNIHSFKFENNDFQECLGKFDEVRSKIIRTNETIAAHDAIKESYIKVLFKHYFFNPEEALDMIEDYQNRMKRFAFQTVEEKTKFEQCKSDDIPEYINKSFSKLSDPSHEMSKREKKDCQMVLRWFIRSVAIHISKMTDSYADHKVRKIISNFD